MNSFRLIFRGALYLIPAIAFLFISGCSKPKEFAWQNFEGQIHTWTFSVDLPEGPFITVEEPTSMGYGEMSPPGYLLKDDGWLFAVMAIEIQRSTMEDPFELILYNAFIQSNWSSNDWGLVERKPSSYGDFPGQEIIVDSNDEKLRNISRVYLVEDQLFRITVTGPNRKSSLENMNRFLDSFKLTNL